MSGQVQIEIAHRYRLESLIARGGMAEVWEGYDRLLDRPVAVKMPLVHLRDQPEFLQRFRREAIAAARLTHPLIVAVYDTGIDPEVGAYIVMELVTGGSLRDVMRSHGRLPVARAVTLAAEVAGALQYAHDRGVVHRDIKPANILLGADTVKVADFGIAKAAVGADDLTKTNVTLGTARYLSPEQVEGRSADARADLYSLGVVLYEMLCGRGPFEAESDVSAALMHLTVTPEPPSMLNPDVPLWVDGVVLTALAKSPADRFATAAAFRRALTSESSGAGAARVGGYVDSPTPPVGVVLDPQRATAGVAPPLRRAARTRRTERVPSAPGPGRIDRRPMIGAVIVLAVIGVVALVLGVRGHGSPGGPGASGGAGAAGSSGGSAAVPVASASSFDPPPGDGVEDNKDLPNLFDGNPATVWRTEYYTNASFGNLKSGVGAYLQLRNPASLTRLVIQSPDTGWRFQIYESDRASAPTTLAGWGQAVANGAVNGNITTVSLPNRPATYVLLWITDLGNNYSRGVGVGELSAFS